MPCSKPGLNPEDESLGMGGSAGLIEHIAVLYFSITWIWKYKIINTEVQMTLQRSSSWAINYWAIYSAVPMGEELFMWRMGRHGRSSKLKLHFLEACSYWSISGRELLGRFASDGTC